jgi:hypothetical protein
MTGQKFYERQPEVLPLTLPAGTRSIEGFGGTLKSTAHLKGNLYHGEWQRVGGVFRLVHPDNVLWSTVPVPLPEPADRPIQAGDWLECVGAVGTNLLKVGRRYLVTGFDRNGWLWFDGVDCTGYSPDRFKRVDGPHAEQAAPVQVETPKRDPYTEHRLNDMPEMVAHSQRQRDDWGGAHKTAACRPRLREAARDQSS